MRFLHVADEAVPDQDDPPADAPMSARDVRHRVVTGAAVDVLQTIGVRFVIVLGAVVTTRLLTPRDFGLVAIGTTIFAFGSLMDDGGVGAALMKRPEPPAKSELQALVAFQFGLELLLVVAIGLVMLQFGLLGQVTTVIVAALPLNAFRAPADILYERRLEYRPLALVQFVQTVVYYVWAIGTILIGWGVFALATAYVVSSLAQTMFLLMLLPDARVAPVPSWRRVRPLLAFGVRYQAVGFLHMLRDQGVNIIVVIFGGVAVLGLWNVAWRIIQIPVGLLSALGRVSFPGMARLVAAGGDVGRTIERVLPLAAIGTGMLVVPLGASVSAWIHVLMGAKWVDAGSAIPPAFFGLMFWMPISVALVGYLWAIGSGSGPLRATAVAIPANWVLLALLPVLSITAAGIAYIGTSLVESIFFIYAVRRTVSFRIGVRFVIIVLLATVAGACGWLVARWVGQDLVGALLSSAAALGVFVAGLAAVCRAEFDDARRLAIRGLRGAVAKTSGGQPADVQPEPAPATG